MKTLKDIQDDTNYTTAVSRNDLRKVSIEWIKELEEHKKLIEREDYTQGKIDWIKHFFNIEEKDLMNIKEIEKKLDRLDEILLEIRIMMEE